MRPRRAPGTERAYRAEAMLTFLDRGRRTWTIVDWPQVEALLLGQEPKRGAP